MSGNANRGALRMLHRKANPPPKDEEEYDEQEDEENERQMEALIYQGYKKEKAFDGFSGDRGKNT